MSNPVSKRALYMRAYRAKKRADKLGRDAGMETPEVVIDNTAPTDPIEIVDRLAAWSKERLKVPYGHKNEGQPLVLPEFAINFLKDALGQRESLLCVARKNAKSAICAVYVLGCLLGITARRGWRGGVCSVSKEKAGELKRQIEEIATMSGLLGQLKIFRSPAPGRIASPWGTLDILSADKTAGHASGFDDVLIDELGLFDERKRDLINGLRSSVSARDGRVISISIMGDSPFTKEMLERKGDEGAAVHVYAAQPDADINDRQAWYDANPGLGTIKSIAYMEDEVRRLGAVSSDESYFRAYDLNQPQSPDREMIISLSDWKGNCEKSALELGRVVMGLDLGGSSSMSCAVCYWPDTGAARVFGAFGATPDLRTRGLADGVGDRYVRMEEAGELKVFPGRVTDVVAFLEWVFEQVTGIEVMGADRYRKAEVEDALQKSGLHLPVIWRGQGAGHNADGSYDVRAFQSLCLKGLWCCPGSLMMQSAIAESHIVRDAAGNPKLNRARSTSRIDALQAAVIAAGIGKRMQASADNVNQLYAGAVG